MRHGKKFLSGKAFWMAAAWCVCQAPPAAAQSADPPRSRTAVSRSDSADKIRQFLLVPVSPGTEVSIDLPVQFRLNSAELTAESERLVERIAEAVSHASLAERRFRVEGHADSSGPAAHNQRLSQRRAESVYNVLVLRSVPIDRLEVQGYGETRPLPGMDSRDPRNRRVEVVRLN